MQDICIVVSKAWYLHIWPGQLLMNIKDTQ
jgi:hypothetical protein